MLTVRRATADDLQSVVELLLDDDLGQDRENLGPSLPQGYRDGFAAIKADPNQFLAVGVRDGTILGMLQLTFIPGLSHEGAWRGQIESVRIARTHRGQGLGRAMIQWAIERCRDRGCRLVQLTSNKTRSDAIRFYGQLGFVPSYKGFKLALPAHSVSRNR